MVVIRFRRAIEATAGAVRYSRAMNTRAQPPDQRASATLGTVKKRMITWGRPAVPIIRVRVNRIMFSLLSTSAVYWLKPRSVTTWFSLTSSGKPDSSWVENIPSIGIGLPVSCREMNTAGMVCSVAIATMVSNEIIMPGLLRFFRPRMNRRADLSFLLLSIRRAAIFVVLLTAYGFYRMAGADYSLTAFGLLSFAAAAQFGPALVGR